MSSDTLCYGTKRNEKRWQICDASRLLFQIAMMFLPAGLVPRCSTVLLCLLVDEKFVLKARKKQERFV
ncbi:hypothetical protein BDZ91DRAFT_354031 [Kalaharituber pfeilii]|nr:hypothetical protein BDZ91DRAFT_354031 [Kalaharituber pfeilii]